MIAEKHGQPAWFSAKLPLAQMIKDKKIKNQGRSICFPAKFAQSCPCSEFPQCSTPSSLWYPGLHHSPRYHHHLHTRFIWIFRVARWISNPWVLMTMKEIEELTSLLGGKKIVLTLDYLCHRLMPTQINHQNQNNYPLQGQYHLVKNNQYCCHHYSVVLL